MKVLRTNTKKITIFIDAEVTGLFFLGATLDCILNDNRLSEIK